MHDASNRSGETTGITGSHALATDRGAPNAQPVIFILREGSRETPFDTFIAARDRVPLDPLATITLGKKCVAFWSARGHTWRISRPDLARCGT